jgi:[ribosomal protein S5]-alanine N-acetyltransferase
MRFILDTVRLHIELYSRKHIKDTLRFYIENAAALKEFEPQRSTGFYTLRYHKRQFRFDKKDMSELRYLSFVISKKEEPERIIGYINVSDIIFGVFDSCRVGYKIDKDERNKGYMQEALKKVAELLFDELGLHRIEANVMPGNAPSIKLLKNLGFVEEGYSKKYLRIDGKWQDHMNFALINDKGEHTDA